MVLTFKEVTVGLFTWYLFGGEDDLKLRSLEALSNWQNIIFPTFYRSSWSQVQSDVKNGKITLSSDVRN